MKKEDLLRGLAVKNDRIKQLEDDLTRLTAQRDALLAAAEAINTWCGTDDGAHALPYEPPWYAQLRVAIEGVR